MKKIVKTHFFALAFVFTILLSRAQAMPPDSLTVYNNTMAVANCAQTDASGELKPNTKNTACKVALNSPGEKETRLAFDVTVNVGTLLNPKDEVRRIEYRAEKTAGKISKLEYSVSVPGTKKADVFSYDIGPTGEYVKARVSQYGQNFAVATREMCAPMKATIEAFGNEMVASCGAVLVKLSGPLKALQGELKGEGLKLGFATPSRSTPSMVRMVALNPERMADAASFVSSCAALFAADDAKKADDGSAATAAGGANSAAAAKAGANQ